MVTFSLYVDLEKAIGDFFKYGLIVLAVIAVIVFAAKIWSYFYYIRTKRKVEKYGIKKVVVLEINKKTVDDTLARAALGYMIAGERGMLFGALTGTQYEEVRSITFNIFFGNGAEQKMTCPADHPFCYELLRKTDL